MNSKEKRKRIGSLLLICFGFLFLINNFGLIPDNFWRELIRFWPLILIIPGIKNLVKK